MSKMFASKHLILLTTLGFISPTVLAETNVGRLSGMAGVTDNGQASYQIPIKLPASTAGMSPSLSLTYGSHSTRGLLGVGWSLSGLSTITRCPKNKVLDGNFNDALVFNAEDKLCLDGQRLIGGNLDVATTYRTEIVGFKKIDAVVNTNLKQPTTLVVTSKDGTKMVYGANDDNYLVEVQGTTGNDRIILTWLLKTVEDINGNTINYTYQRDLNTGSFVPLAINYSTNTTVSPIINATHQVIFDYIENTDVPYSYIKGGLSRNNKLLSKITVNSVNTSGGFEEIRRYQLAYRTNGTALKTSALTKRPLLDSVTQCDKNVCLKPTVFTWLDNKLNFAKIYEGPTLSDAAGWGEERYYSTIQYPDINGDGKSDICARSSVGVACNLSTGAGFGSSISGPSWSDSSGWGEERYYSTIQYPDINGDGKSDICARNSVGVTCSLSTGAGFGTNIAGPSWSDTAGWGDTTKKHYLNIRWSDLDQDGRADVCGIGPQGLACFYTKVSNAGVISFESALTESSWVSVDTNKIYPVLFMMDADHNQKTDVCARLLTVESGATKGKLSCLIQKTTGSSIINWESLATNTEMNWQDTYLVDVNGDGFIDRCSVNAGMVWCFKNKSTTNDITKGLSLVLVPITNSATLQDESISIKTRIKYLIDSLDIKNSVGFLKSDNSGPTYVSDVNSYKGTVQFVDLNQDGLLDMCMRQPDGYRCRLQERQLGSKMVRTISEYVSKCLGSTIAEDDVCILFNEMANASPDGFLDVFYSRLDIPAWADNATDSSKNWGQEKYYRTIQLADINGDGYLEACGRESTGIRCYGTDNTLSDKISTITDGFDQQVIFSYKPLTDNSIYTKATSTVYPNMSLQPAISVVSSLKTSNGLGGFFQTDYTYGELIAHATRGLQGFAWKEARQVHNQQISYSHFKQEFPFTGLVDSTVQKWCSSPTQLSKDCTLLGRKNTTWKSIDKALPGSYEGILPYIENVTEEVWDIATNPQ